MCEYMYEDNTMIRLTIAFALMLGACSEGETKVIPAPDPIIIFPAPDDDIPPVRPPPRPGFVNLDLMEDTILLDLQNIGNEQDRLNSRYIIACDRHNQGEGVDEFRQGVDIALNRLSAERFLYNVTPIGNAGCIFRYDIDDYTITTTEYQLLEDESALQFVSNTVRNQNIQFLTQTARPYMFGVDILCTAFECDEVTDRAGRTYYDIVDQAVDTTDFLADQGVVRQDQVDDETALYSGFSQSQIALGKTRLIGVFESDNGYCVGTHDTVLGGDDLFQNPFSVELAGAGGVVQSDKVFIHDAQEWICSLDNGMFGLWRLNNAGDIAEVEAPTNVVVNVNFSEVDPALRIGDCNDCHFQNVMIPFADQIEGHILSNSAFDQNEKLIGSIFFDYDAITAVIDQINRANRTAMAELGIDTGSDPLTNTLFKPFRREMDIVQVAAFTMLDTDTFRERLRGTAISSQVFGNLINGGKVSLAVLSANFETLVDELNLYEDEEL